VKGEDIDFNNIYIIMALPYQLSHILGFHRLHLSEAQCSKKEKLKGKERFTLNHIENGTSS
jgi:hypothetical protein